MKKDEFQVQKKTYFLFLSNKLFDMKIDKSYEGTKRN